MAAVETDWEPIPKYSDLLRQIIDIFKESYRENFIEKSESHPIESTRHYYNFSNRDISYIALSSIVCTIFSHLASEFVFKPLARHYALTPTNARKVPESALKFIFYLSSWSYTCYVVILSGKYRFFQQPSTMWHNWTLEEPLPSDIYFIYIVECGFYIHLLYAVLFMDARRKDFCATVVHHVVTLILILFSYSLRCHNIGCLIYFLFDMCEVFLEFSKLNIYFRIQGNTMKKTHEILAEISTFCFIVIWFGARLYCFPLKGLYSVTSNFQELKSIIPCSTLMTVLLCILQLLQIYWTVFILQLLYLVATGQMKEIDDTREYNVEKKEN